jgi:uncharacterized integral membrane protein
VGVRVVGVVRVLPAVLAVSVAVVAVQNTYGAPLVPSGQARPEVPVGLVVLASALLGVIPGLLVGLRLGGSGASRAARDARRLAEQAAERERALEVLRQRTAELRYDLDSARRRLAPCSCVVEAPPEVPDGAGRWDGLTPGDPT